MAAPKIGMVFVLAKSDMANKAGVKTGMVNWEARQLCRDLIFVPPQYDQYLKYSKLTQAIYQRWPAVPSSSLVRIRAIATSGLINKPCKKKLTICVRKPIDICVELRIIKTRAIHAIERRPTNGQELYIQKDSRG